MSERSPADGCPHPVHGLDPSEVMMLRTAVSTVQTALWGNHPPTVFGNSETMLDIALSLDEAFVLDGAPRATVHHAKDGCFHLHYPTKAFLWADHLSACPVKEN